MAYTLPTTGTDPKYTTKQALEALIDSAIAAVSSAAINGFIYATDTTDGLARTSDGEGFFTASDLQLIFWLNDGGAATQLSEIGTPLTQSQVEELQANYSTIAAAASQVSQDAAQVALDRMGSGADADRAEAAADAAALSGDVYADEAAGRSAVADDAYYSAESTFPDGYLDLFQRVDASTSTLIATYPSKAVLDSLGTGSNIILDPYFTGKYTALGGFRDRSRVASSSAAFEIVTRSGSPFDMFGKSVVRTATTGNLHLNFYPDEMGVSAGDQIKVAARVFGQTGQNVAAYVNYYTVTETRIGAANQSVLAGTAMDETSKQVTLSTMTVPANCQYLTITFYSSGTTGEIAVDAIWGNVGTTVTSGPYTDNEKQVPLAATRVIDVEAKASDQFLRWSYSSVDRILAPDKEDPIIGGNGFRAWGVELTPSEDFNCLIPAAIRWDVARTPPSRIVMLVHAAATGVEPLGASGTLLSVCEIEVDPDAGQVSNAVFPTRDPFTGELITLTVADLMGHYVVSYYGYDADGGACNGIGPIRGEMPNAATDRGRYNGTIGYADGNGPVPIAIPHGLATGLTQAGELTPAGRRKTFAEVDGDPSLIALPPVIYGVVGAEMGFYLDQAMLGRSEDVGVGLSFASTYRGKLEDERWAWTVTAAGDSTATFTTTKGKAKSTTSIVRTVAATSAAGTKTIHVVGDSLTENGEILRALTDIAAADASTSLTFIGTKALASPYASTRHDGYSGQTISAVMSETIPGYGASPFYDPVAEDFDYAYFLSNGGHADPDIVVLKFGPNDVSARASDGEAVAVGRTIAAKYEVFAASVIAAVPSAKVLIDLPVPHGRDADGFTSTNGVRGAAWRMNRNEKLIAGVLVEVFGGREADGIYLSHGGIAVDPVTGFRRAGPTLKHAGIKLTGTYATFAGMDLTPADGALYYVTDVANYFVKVGPTTKGTWRVAGPIDGVVRRMSDTVHVADPGGRQNASAWWAGLKVALA